MATAAQHLLGQLVDGRFPLRKLIGVSPNSAVFLTDLPNARPSEPASEGAIKLIPEDPDTSDQQLERWRAVSALSHPGLLPILHFGRCSVDGAPCLFVVTELASENLGELLPQRALSTEETGGMMAPVLATLDFLHEKGMVHAGLKPSNVLAVRDAIKLSSDRVLPAGEPASAWPLASPYAPPESLLFPASDLWSLGITMYETLTQYLPKQDSSGHYVLPQLPSPFSEVIHGVLMDDPTKRMALDDVRSLLDPSFVPKPKPEPIPAVAQPSSRSAVSQEVSDVATQLPLDETGQAAAASVAAGASPSPRSVPLPKVDPLSVPLSPVAPSSAAQPPSRIPVSSLPNVNVTIAAPRRMPEPRSSGSSLKYFVIGAVATLLVAFLIVPRILRNSPDRQSASPPPAAAPLPEKAAPSGPASAPSAPSAPAMSSSTPAKTPGPDAQPSVTASSPTNRSASAPTSAPEPSAGTTTATRSKSTAVSAPASDSSNPEVTHKVIPDVSQKARDTIRGTVRINVRVQLNSDGSVSSAGLDSPVPSQFFANLALKAARQWQFAPSAGSSALLRFDFTNTNTTASVSP